MKNIRFSMSDIRCTPCVGWASFIATIRSFTAAGSFTDDPRLKDRLNTEEPSFRYCRTHLESTVTQTSA
jgi:hypothetical protein